nr:MAG TPA: hypothetical protein [Bacteriophage sp.]
MSIDILYIILRTNFDLTLLKPLYLLHLKIC